jgi:hypothetical protein
VVGGGSEELRVGNARWRKLIALVVPIAIGKMR